MRLMLGMALSATLLLTGAASAQSGNSCGRNGDYASLSGSRWTGTVTWEGDAPLQQTMTLMANCVVKYSYNGNTYTNGRWLQRDKMVMWDTNDHFAVYLGYQNGDQMAGASANETGASGSWTFKRAD